MTTKLYLRYSSCQRFDIPQSFVVNIYMCQRTLILALLDDEDDFNLIREIEDIPMRFMCSVTFPLTALRSTTCLYNWFQTQLLINNPPIMGSRARNFLISGIIDSATALLSSSPDRLHTGFQMTAQLEVEFARMANQSEVDFIRRVDIAARLAETEAPRNFKGVKEGKYEGAADGKEEITCSVCLEDLMGGTEYKSLPCSHVFHSRCIDQWLEESDSCPNCRMVLELEEVEASSFSDIDIPSPESRPAAMLGLVGS